MRDTIGALRALPFAVLFVIAAGCHADDWLTYAWDDRRVLCSNAVDDLNGGIDRGLAEETMRYAEREGVVALFHAHVPDVTVSRDAIEWMLRMADAHHLDYVTYDQLGPDQPPRAGLALAFDDQATEAWWSMRDLLLAHGARVTFFVTRFANYTDEMKSTIATLASDGHDIEAHSVNHLHAETYVGEHGSAAYLADEVVPSFDVLRTVGYAPTAYAFPFGAANEEIWDQVLAIDGVARVRVSPRACPY